MKINSVNLIFALLVFTTFSCNTGQKKEASGKLISTEKSILFIPKPQHVEKQKVKTLEIGEQAPGFTLPDENGEMVSLNDFASANALVVVFTCTHCPTAQAYEDRLIQFAADYKTRGVQVVAIMPNSNLGLLPEECGYTEYDDAFENMKLRAVDKHYNFPYLYDGDNEAVAIKYGPTTTPHVFVFDQDRKLKYTGNLDQHEKPGTGHAENLRAATDAVLEGKSVANPKTKSFGCSIKWAWKDYLAKKVNTDWNKKQISLEKVNIERIKNLVQNKGSKKLRLINVWAIWCAPCVIEYPDLVELQRMYGQRYFEFVSLSSDKVENEEKVHEFLQKSHSAIQNYIYAEDDSYKLIEAVDPEWNGALPYTILIEPGGNIVWKCQGSVDMTELKKTIVEHPMIGRYF